MLSGLLIFVLVLSQNAALRIKTPSAASYDPQLELGQNIDSDSIFEVAPTELQKRYNLLM
jgi:hypothetical protein